VSFGHANGAGYSSALDFPWSAAAAAPPLPPPEFNWRRTQNLDCRRKMFCSLQCHTVALSKLETLTEHHTVYKKRKKKKKKKKKKSSWDQNKLTAA
jgi:hypothetical protein